MFVDESLGFFEDPQLAQFFFFENCALSVEVTAAQASDEVQTDMK